MQKVLVEITMSLDGFVAGPQISEDNPMGLEGLRLHEWIFGGKTEVDANLIDTLMQSCGAVIVGSRTYTVAIEKAWGGVNPFPSPAFVICNKLPKIQAEGFTFISDGIPSALAKAKAVAGYKKILIMGGANIIQQSLKLRLVDELVIHIASVIFSSGTRLFDNIGEERLELKQNNVIHTPAATHIYYDVVH